MSDSHLAAYLTDHLAGSVIAIDLLAQLEQNRNERQLTDAVANLRAQIESDQRELQVLMHKLGIKQSVPRKAAGWLTAKIGEAKLRLEDSSQGALRLLESLEAVALGIDGKLALWRALQSITEIAPTLEKIEYPRLISRAKEQRQVVEELRLSAARAALVPGLESARP